MQVTDEMVERVARSDVAMLLVQDEQGPWPGTAAYEREVRDVARQVLEVALAPEDEPRS